MALFTAGYLGTVPATRKYMHEHYGLTPWLGDFLGAACSGLLCVFISQPLDTVKTCMQGDVRGERYGSMMSTLRQLHKEYGSVAAFYRGYWWRAALVMVDFMALNGIAKFMAPLLFPGR